MIISFYSLNVEENLIMLINQLTLQMWLRVWYHARNGMVIYKRAVILVLTTTIFYLNSFCNFVITKLELKYQ